MASCDGFALSSVEQTATKDGDVWVHISYLAAWRDSGLKQVWQSIPLDGKGKI
ncbi:hypothetical protein [Cyclobacterium plantarum]|uniref:hypothetical protein n=1 Tax=Cyclobacterium plantarum TaxID=2716263 RepID=UPI003F72A937